MGPDVCHWHTLFKPYWCDSGWWEITKNIVHCQLMIMHHNLLFDIMWNILIECPQCTESIIETLLTLLTIWDLILDCVARLGQQYLVRNHENDCSVPIHHILLFDKRWKHIDSESMIESKISSSTSSSTSSSISSTTSSSSSPSLLSLDVKTLWQIGNSGYDRHLRQIPTNTISLNQTIFPISTNSGFELFEQI